MSWTDSADDVAIVRSALYTDPDESGRHGDADEALDRIEIKLRLLQAMRDLHAMAVREDDS